MRKFIIFLIATFSFNSLNAQNLIPNGDFESYSSCPSSWNEIDSALFWTTPTTNNSGVSGTPDYFNQCSSFLNMDVPYNYFGYQQPHSGNAYAGIYLWYGNVPEGREYIEVPLTSSLTTNICYHFEMYVNVGDICKYTIDNIGVYFSDSLVSGINNLTVLPFVSQINNITGNYFDDQNWTLVSADYTALGGENFLIIGNFKTDAFTDTVLLDTATFSATYCYIDDVSLTMITGISNFSGNSIKNIYPNPSVNNITIEIPTIAIETTLTILNVNGQEMIKKQIEDTKTQIDISNLKSGMYFVKLVSNKNVEVRKIIKE